MPRLMTVKVSPNLSCSSRRHWSVRLAGVTMSVRSTRPRNLSSLMRQPGHDGLPGPRIVGNQEPDAGLGEQMAVDGIHLVRQRIDLGHGDGEVRVVLVGQPDAMGFGGKAEVGRVAVEGGQLARLRDLDRAVELLGLEQLGPEPLGVQADRLNLDPAAPSLGRQHLDRLGPVRAFQGGAFLQLVQNLFWAHGATAGSQS